LWWPLVADAALACVAVHAENAIPDIALKHPRIFEYKVITDTLVKGKARIQVRVRFCVCVCARLPVCMCLHVSVFVCVCACVFSHVYEREREG
jgi:hypothetical protein